ncbi:MAG TPA: malonyl-CoA synthase [Stellaceae bacterium]|nr:malonyl-CoA synthase [Stellaceae bacterium]
MANHLFDHIFGNAPNGTATFLKTPAGRVWTYDDLWAVSARQANALVHLGIKPGDRVAVQVEKSPEALVLYLATIRAGAIFLPLNTAYTPTEIAYFLGDAEATVFIGRPENAKELGELCARLGNIRFETLGKHGDTGSFAELSARQPTTFSDAARGPDDLAMLLYTSGTTGRSKGAMLGHGNVLSNARALVETWHYTKADTLIHALPIFHTHGLLVATNVTLFAGASMIFLTKFDADQILGLMGEATVLMGVPTFYTRLLDHKGLSPETTKGMRLFISGSAPLLADTHREWRAKTGHVILERYGMTETNMNTSNPYDGDRIAGTVGFPLPGTTVRVTDPETGKVLGPEEIGMIEVQGPNVFQGYWRMPEKTAEEFRDGFFVTGDLGKIDARGYVHIVGRQKDLVITGGFNVYPKEIENEIDALPDVIESAVVGLPHADFGEAVTAIVAIGNGVPLDEKAVIALLEQRLAKFKCPKRVVCVAELPRNTMGKVQKNILREQYGGLYKTA